MLEINVQIVDRDRGMKDMSQRKAELPSVQVGVHEEAGVTAHPSRLGQISVAEVAAHVEFTGDQSFLRDTFDQHVESVVTQAERVLNQYFADSDWLQDLGELGGDLAQLCKRTISEKELVDTGTLHDSITHRLSSQDGE